MGLLGLVFVLAMGRELRMDVRGHGCVVFQWHIAEGARDALEFRVNGRLVERQEEGGVWQTCRIFLLDDDEFHLSWQGRSGGEVRLLKSLTSDFPVDCPREIPFGGGTFSIRVEGGGCAELHPAEATVPFCSVRREEDGVFQCAVRENPSGQTRILRFHASREDEELDVAVERVIEIVQGGFPIPEEKN